MPNKDTPIGGINDNALDQSQFKSTDDEWYDACLSISEERMNGVAGEPFEVRQRNHSIMDMLRADERHSIYLDNEYSDVEVIEIMIFLSMLCISPSQSESDSEVPGERSDLLKTESQRIKELLKHTRIPTAELEEILRKAEM